MSQEKHDVYSSIEAAQEELAKPNLTGGDEALKVIGGHADDVISEEEAAAVLKKIDWRLIPVMTIVNAVQLTDKNVCCFSSPPFSPNGTILPPRCQLT
jgi:hypothetical protein